MRYRGLQTRRSAVISRRLRRVAVGAAAAWTAGIGGKHRDSEFAPPMRFAAIANAQPRSIGLDSVTPAFAASSTTLSSGDASFLIDRWTVREPTAF